MLTPSPTQASKEHMIPDKNGSAERMNPAPFAPSNYTVPVSSFSSEPQSTSECMIEQCCLPSDESSPFDLDAPCLVDLRAINIEPPITNSTLSQLDPHQLHSNLLLRHDLNFDPNIQYRPVTDGEVGKFRMVEAYEYWNAMRVELTRWFMGWADSGICNSKRCCCASEARPSRVDKPLVYPRLIRLPRMFDTVRQILKSLLPEEEWPTIDRRLDVDLLVQQLENNTGDFVDLSDWLGTLLRRFCSPDRDLLIASLTSTLRHGVHCRDVSKVLGGLMKVFGILEVMKLDCANHNIRNLRFVLIDNTVDFEQRDFLERIAKGWNVNSARIWFATQWRRKPTPSRIHTLAASVTDLIISNSDNLPPTLTLDYVRIRTLQLKLDTLLYQAACRWTFEEISESLSQRPIPQSAYDSLHSRIAILTTDEDSRAQPARQMENITLEIVREAYRVSHIDKIPTPEDLESAESNLVHATDPSTSVFQQLRSYLAEDLHQLVEEEVQAAKDLTPVQMSTRFVLDNLAQTRRVTEQSDMLRFAQQIAHISILHWRVWAPILYDLPEEDS